MGYKISLTKTVEKILKKTKNKKLVNKYLDCIYDIIADDPYSGVPKKGNLHGVYTKGFLYESTEYRIAYQIRGNELIIILLVGSHENFYRELSRKIKID